ncbi:hypothetical protein NFI96_021666 [Prochilodus magdalenae]|nr:hypothetical protein NFI96_021666 [Prochilodus magdalenae]
MEFHFHWGKNGEPGSEHTIDGEQYPMEMHIVHIRQDFNTVTEAVTSPTGLAVLGFFFEESASANNKYNPIITKLQNVIHSGKVTYCFNHSHNPLYRTLYRTKGNTSAIDIVSLDSLIPSHNALNKYFRYNGSLTTPNCQESVIWTVFENPIQLSKAQLSEFSRLQFESGIPMTGTFRPTQPLYGRKVYYSGCNVPSLSGTNNLQYGVDYSGSHVTTGSTILVISAVLTAFLTRSE